MKKIKSYTETLSEKENIVRFKIEPNTMLVFQHYKFKDYIYPVYLACLKLRNSIDVQKIIKILPTIEKIENIPRVEKHIKKSIQRLLDKKYLIRHRNGELSIANQGQANIYNIQKFRIKFLNFYDSVILIKNWQIKFYKEKSKEDSIKNFLFGELLARTYFEVPTTHKKIEKDLLLTRYDVRKIKEIESKQYHINHFDSSDTAFFNINNNFSCIGNKFHKNFYATDFQISTYIKHKTFYIDENLVDEWDEVLNHSQKIELIKKEAGLKNNGSLSEREIATCYPAFFSKTKREYFLPMLSEKLVINGLKHNNFMRKKIIKHDIDMLWWKDKSDLINYQHPYTFNAPVVNLFHIQK